MDPHEKYRERAAFCLRLAQTSTPDDRLILIEMAQAWQQIAERASTLVHFVEHATHQTPEDRIDPPD